MTLAAADHRLRLLFAEGVATGEMRWRATLSFIGAAPPIDPDATIPVEAIACRAVEQGDYTVLAPIAAAWDVPGRRLRVDLVGRGSATVAEAYRLRVRHRALVDPDADTALLVLRPAAAVADAVPEPLNYLTKDYAGFRKLILDAATRHLPAWSDRSEADPGVTIVETLAYAADNLSYFQDAVASEAYLETARQRLSVRRHLRLLGYRLGEGVAPRLFVRIDVAGDRPVTIAAGCRFVTLPGAPAVAADDDPRAVAAIAGGAAVFEGLHALTVDPQLARLPLVSTVGKLPAGSTHVAIALPRGLEAGLARLAAGRVFALRGRRIAGGPRVSHPFRVDRVLFAEDDGSGGRVAVLVADAADALPWPLIADEHADVCGNLMLAEYGRTERTGPLSPAIDHAGAAAIALGGASVLPVAPYVDDAPAAALLAPAAFRASPAIVLHEYRVPAEGGAPDDERPPRATWRCVPDLLESTRHRRAFVVEPALSEGLRIRFGDGVFGRRPPATAIFAAEYRTGALEDASVGEAALDTVLLPRRDAAALGGVVRAVTNVTSAAGLVLPERSDRAILSAQARLRTLRTCVTLADYAAAARTVPGVAEAAAKLLHAGGMETILVRVRGEDAGVSSGLVARVERLLDQVRLAGRQVLVAGPRWARLTIAVRVRAAASHSAAARARVEQALSAGPDGFFAPDRVCFGMTLYATALTQFVRTASGVDDIELTRFDRVGAGGEEVRPALPVAEDELPLPVAIAVAWA